MNLNISLSKITLAVLTLGALLVPIYGQKPGGGGGSAPQPLTEVTHDSTLAGKGTTSSPLGVANNSINASKLADGAITHSKIRAANSPSVGQTLTFDGTGLLWATPPTAGFRFVDASGNEIGPFTGPGSVALFVPEVNAWTNVSLRPSGFIDFAVFFYSSSNCSGEGHAAVLSDGGFFIDGFFHDGLLYYPIGPPQSVNYNSRGDQSGQCYSESGSIDLSPFATKPLSYSTPFKLVR